MRSTQAPVHRLRAVVFGWKPHSLVLLAGKAILPFGILFTQLGQPARASPKLEVDRLHFDAGIQSPTNLVHHSFHLKNTGDEDLLILKVQDSCAGRFTEVRLEKDRLVPGESTALHAVMRMNPGDESFVQRGTIGLSTNEPEGPYRHSLRIEGRVRSGFRSGTSAIHLGNIAMGSPIETSVKLECTTERTWRLLGVKSTKGLAQTRVQTSEDGRLHEVFITLPPQQALGMVFDQIVFSTDNPDCPMARVQIAGTCVDPNQAPRRASSGTSP